MSIYTIRLNLEPNPDGIYTVTSPDIPGLITEGKTPFEIQQNVQEALDALKDAWNEMEMACSDALSRDCETPAQVGLPGTSCGKRQPPHLAQSLHRRSCFNSKLGLQKPGSGDGPGYHSGVGH